MAKRSNRRGERLRIPKALEAARPLSPHRADAHHGQERQLCSTYRSDIRSQSHPFAKSQLTFAKREESIYGIQYRRAIADWTPAFAGVTNSDRIQTFPCRINSAFCRFRHMLPGTALSASRHWAPGGGVVEASNSNPFNWLGKGGVAGTGIALAKANPFRGERRESTRDR